MRGGRLEQLDTPAVVYSSPATEFVAQFVGSVSRLPGKMVGPATVSVLGSIVTVPGGASAYLSPGSELDVLVRPESIVIEPSPLGEAVVARVSFLGATVRVVAALPGGIEVASTLPASDGMFLPAGARADVRLRSDVLFVLARNSGS
jgi:putative spermidine/putrescine transport system ATP-binding protein